MVTTVVLTGSGAAPGSPFTFNAERVECEITIDPPMVVTPSSKSLGTFPPISMETGVWYQQVTVQVFVNTLAAAAAIRTAVKSWWQYGVVTLQYDAVDEDTDTVKVMHGNAQIETPVELGEKVLMILNFVRSDFAVVSYL